MQEPMSVRCAIEKKEREEARSKNTHTSSTESWKRKPSLEDDVRDSPSVAARGKNVILPTVPPSRVLMDADRKMILETHERRIAPTQIANCTPSAPITPSPSPSSSPFSSLLPAASELHRISSALSSLTAILRLDAPASSDNVAFGGLQSIPSSILLRNCVINHHSLRDGLPLVSLTHYIPNSTTALFPLSARGSHPAESYQTVHLPIVTGSQSQLISATPLPTSCSSNPIAPYISICSPGPQNRYYLFPSGQH